VKVQPALQAGHDETFRAEIGTDGNYGLTALLKFPTLPMDVLKLNLRPEIGLRAVVNPRGCTTVVQMYYNQVVQTRRKPAARKTTASVRQSVTIPAQLAREVRRVAKERNVTMSRALVTLAGRGVEAEAAARARLTAAYEEFMAEEDPVRKSKVGEDLIRAVFGRAAIAEDPLR
jgi:hypothetical protein